MANEQKKTKKGFTRTSIWVGLVLIILILGFSFAPGINSTTTDGGIVNLYSCANWMWRGPSGGLTSAFIFIALALACSILSIITSYTYPKDKNGSKSIHSYGESSVGFIEIFEAFFLFTAGMLFCFTEYFAKLNILNNGGSTIDIYNNSFIGWGAIVVAILCFIGFLYLLFDGGNKISYRAKVNAEEEAKLQQFN